MSEQTSPFVVPDTLEAEQGSVVLNPSAIGNPHEPPAVWVGDDLRRVLNPCDGDAPSRGGYCGGLNGHHAGDCPAVHGA